MQLAVHPAVTTVTRVWYENAVQSGFVIYDTTNVQHSDAERGTILLMVEQIPRK